MALPPPPSYHPVIDFGPATPWPTKHTPKVRAKRKPLAIKWRLFCLCGMTYDYTRKPKADRICGRCPRKYQRVLFVQWLGDGSPPYSAYKIPE